MTDPTWRSFHDALEWGLSELPYGSALILTDDVERHRILQYAKDFDSLTAEIINSCDRLDGPDQEQAFADRAAALDRLGWRTQFSYYDYTDHQFVVPGPLEPEDYYTMAYRSVGALHDILEIPSPSALRYRAFLLHNGAPVGLPVLTLERDPQP